MYFLDLILIMKNLLYFLPALLYFASCQSELVEKQDITPIAKEIIIDTVYIIKPVYIDSAINKVYAGIEEILEELSNIPIITGHGRVIDTLITIEEKNNYFYHYDSSFTSSNDTVTIIQSSRDTIYITPIDQNVHQKSNNYIANSLQVLLNGNEYDLTLGYDIWFAGVGEYLREFQGPEPGLQDTIYTFHFYIESLYGTVQSVGVSVDRINGEYDPNFSITDYSEIRTNVKTNVPGKEYITTTSSSAPGGVRFDPEIFNITLKGDKFDIEFKTYVVKMYSEIGSNAPRYNTKKVLLEIYGYDLPLGVL